MVTVGNADILEAARHLSAGGFLPATNPAFVNHGAGAQKPIAALRLPGGDESAGRFKGGRERETNRQNSGAKTLTLAFRHEPEQGPNGLHGLNPLKSHTCKCEYTHRATPFYTHVVRGHVEAGRPVPDALGQADVETISGRPAGQLTLLICSHCNTQSKGGLRQTCASSACGRSLPGRCDTSCVFA